MALFLPALLHCDDFRLDAELRWGPRREPRSFHLDAERRADHAPARFGRLRPGRDPRVRRAVPPGAPAWELSEFTDVIELGREGVWVPDYRAVHRATGTDVFIEVLGFWKKSSLDRLLRLLPQLRAAPLRPGDLRQAEGR